MNSFTFTSESVCAGHPDKICDQVSDAIVDAILQQDSFGRVAVETVATKNRLIIAGEVSTTAVVDYEKIARDLIKSLGYIDPDYGFSYHVPIDIYIHEQSAEIARGVKKKGAGDQGMMFRFACKETENLMPLPISLAHALTHGIDKARETKSIPYLRPDGKSQVTVEYQNNKPTRVTSVVLAVPHDENISLDDVKNELYVKVVSPVLNTYGYSITEDKLIVNCTGIWHRGGPASDTGLTGRKIVVDTYGGYARVGGGAFRGKDPTKVDRSGAYAARFLAKNIVAAGIADKVEVRLAYFIGAKKPIMQEVETFGTEKISSRCIRNFMLNLLNTSVEGILEGLNLRRPIYLPTASYGHFERDNFPWEKVI